MPDPLLTIVTINRNHASGLARTVESLRPLRADANVEFVFIDGASIDDSLVVANSFYKPGEISSEPDDGIYDAMNKGLGIAHGAYVIWINSGDELLSSSWPMLRTILERSPATVVAGSVERGESSSLSTNYCSRVHLSSSDRLPFQHLWHQAMFIRRSKAIQYRGYPPEYKIVSDRALTLFMYFAKEPFEYTSITVARYEIGGVSSNAFIREAENYRLDLELGLIGYGKYLLGRSRSYLYHRITIPVWDLVKALSRSVGVSVPPKPALLVRLLREPFRS